MLTKRESEVMKAVYALCREGVCLVAPADLLALLSPKEKWTQDGLEKVLTALSLDNYFDLLSSERKGEKMYVITLRESGLAYPRNAQQFRRDLFLKLGFTVASAVIAFLVGLILRWIF